MFSIDTKITDLKIKERNLYKVLFSMNNHQVATPEMNAEDAKSYVFFFREGGRYLSYIGLYFLRTDRKLYYSHSANPFPEKELSDVENEARGFAEDMGAMLDELALDKMSDAEKDRWIDEQDIFSTRKSAPGQPADSGLVQDHPVVEQSAPVAPPVSAAQAATAETPAPTERAAPVQPAAAPQSAPATPSASPERITPDPQSSARRPEPAAQSMPEPAAGPVEQPKTQTPVEPREPSRLQRKQTAAPRQPAGDVLEQAVRAGIAKAPKQPLKKVSPGSANVSSRDKEALARLLSSF